MIKISVDLSEILGLKDIDKTIEKIVKEANQQASKEVYAHILDEADKKLHSRKANYVKAVVLEREDDTYIVALKKEAGWIEDGMDRTDMVPYYLRSQHAKTGKNGKKYMVIPFSYGKGSGTPTAAQSDLIQTIKAELKRKKINYSKIENDSSGAPKIGKLHEFSIGGPPKTAQGPGQGWGPIGAPRQGASGIPFLDKVKIYQSKNSKGKVTRSIMTFRTVVPEHSGRLWTHPGLKPVNIFDETEQWYLKELDSRIIPDIMKKLGEL